MILTPLPSHFCHFYHTLEYQVNTSPTHLNYRPYMTRLNRIHKCDIPKQFTPANQNSNNNDIKC